MISASAVMANKRLRRSSSIGRSSVMKPIEGNGAYPDFHRPSADGAGGMFHYWRLNVGCFTNFYQPEAQMCKGSPITLDNSGLSHVIFWRFQILFDQ